MERGDRQQKSARRKAEEMHSGGVAGQNVLAVRQMQIYVSVVLSMSECCAHPDGLPSLLALFVNVFISQCSQLKSRKQGGNCRRLHFYSVQPCCPWGRLRFPRPAVREGWLRAGAGEPGHRGAHVREGAPAPACRSAPPHVRPRGKGRHMAPPEHSALSPAPCISC